MIPVCLAVMPADTTHKGTALLTRFLFKVCTLFSASKQLWFTEDTLPNLNSHNILRFFFLPLLSSAVLFFSLNQLTFKM